MSPVIFMSRSYIIAYLMTKVSLIRSQVAVAVALSGLGLGLARPSDCDDDSDDDSDVEGATKNTCDKRCIMGFGRQIRLGTNKTHNSRHDKHDRDKKTRDKHVRDK